MLNSNNNNSRPIPIPTPTPTTPPTKQTNKNDLVISYYLLKQCKLWVWDFDDTLIDTKYYYKSNMDPIAIRERTDAQLTNEVPHWRYFKRLVEYLITHGKYVAIASFGTYEIIKAYMDRIMGFNQTFFTRNNLIAPVYDERTCRGFNFPPNKNEYIYKIMKHYKIEDFKSVVLFDDLPSNIADAIGIGIIGVQIATPNNGDKVYNSGGQGSGGADGNEHYASGGVSYSGPNMYFNPSVMVLFDKKMINSCGKEIYLNRTYTGVTNKYSNSDKSSYTGLSYDKTDFGNDIIHEDFVPVAFGTGIGDRKISTSPEYRWNKLNVAQPPQWVNGNWAESTLGGESESFWDKYHSVKKNVSSNTNNTNNKKKNENNNYRNDNVNNNYKNNNENDNYKNIKRKMIYPYNGRLNDPSNKIMGVSEGFTVNINENVYDNNDETNYNELKSSKYGKCNTIKGNWIVLSLILIIMIMVIIIYNVV